LQTVIRIRREVVDDARRQLTEALIRESTAERATHAAEVSIARETELASELSGTDAAVEAFGRWLRQARQGAERARKELERAATETGRARANSAAARAAARIAEELQARRAAEHAAELIKREQQAVDDLVGPRESGPQSVAADRSVDGPGAAR
jgi:flagellar export protein FliJ